MCFSIKEQASNPATSSDILHVGHLSCLKSKAATFLPTFTSFIRKGIWVYRIGWLKEVNANNVQTCYAEYCVSLLCILQLQIPRPSESIFCVKQLLTGLCVVVCLLLAYCSLQSLAPCTRARILIAHGLFHFFAASGYRGRIQVLLICSSREIAYNKANKQTESQPCLNDVIVVSLAATNFDFCMFLVARSLILPAYMLGLIGVSAYRRHSTKVYKMCIIRTCVHTHEHVTIHEES